MTDNQTKKAATDFTRRRVVAAAAGGLATQALSSTRVSAQEGQTGTVLITGSNRGIGLRIATIYAERGWNVIATARKPEAANDLKAVQANHHNLSIERLDVTEDEQIAALVDKLKGQPIDVLLNNAAILGEPNQQNFGNYNFETFHKILDVNVAGPLKVAQAFIDNVEQSEQKKIVAITSGQGSITTSRGSSIVFYNLSKSALNMAMHSLAMDLRQRGIIVALISPGAGANIPLLTPEQSALMVIDMIDKHDLNMAGKFMAHDGKEYNW